MKHLLTLLLLACSASALFAQSGTNALVRIVHASADAPAVDVLINGQVALEGIPFRGFTDYIPLPAGSYAVALRPTGTTTTVLTQNFTISPGVAYTFIAAGRLANGPGLRIFGVGDDLNPVAGSVKFRVVHAASTAPNVDVYATTPYAALAASTPILTGVPFGIGSGYFTVPAGLYQARVTAAGTRTVAIRTGGLELNGGTVRTLVALDPMTPGGAFEILALPDVVFGRVPSF